MNSAGVEYRTENTKNIYRENVCHSYIRMRISDGMSQCPNTYSNEDMFGRTQSVVVQEPAQCDVPDTPTGSENEYSSVEQSGNQNNSNNTQLVSGAPNQWDGECKDICADNELCDGKSSIWYEHEGKNSDIKCDIDFLVMEQHRLKQEFVDLKHANRMYKQRLEEEQFSRQQMQNEFGKLKNKNGHQSRHNNSFVTHVQGNNYKSKEIKFNDERKDDKEATLRLRNKELELKLEDARRRIKLHEERLFVFSQHLKQSNNYATSHQSLFTRFDTDDPVHQNEVRQPNDVRMRQWQYEQVNHWVNHPRVFETECYLSTDVLRR